MKYTIEGFSQEAAISIVKEIEVNGKKTILRLDSNDLLILRWFVDFYPKMKKYIENNIQYAWVNYESILNDLPLLKIEKRSVYNRFNKMVELGILEHKHVKDGGSFSYYSFGVNYSLLIENPASKPTYGGVCNELHRGMYSITEGVCNELPTKDSSINNSSINNSNYAREEEKNDFKCAETKPEKTHEEIKQKEPELEYKKIVKEAAELIDDVRGTKFKEAPNYEACRYVLDLLDKGYKYEKIMEVVTYALSNWEGEAKNRISPQLLFRPDKFGRYLDIYTDIKSKQTRSKNKFTPKPRKGDFEGISYDLEQYEKDTACSNDEDYEDYLNNALDMYKK